MEPEVLAELVEHEPEVPVTWGPDLPATVEAGTAAASAGTAGEAGNGDVGSRSSVRFWITLVVGGTRHTDPASDPKTRIQQS